MSRNPLIEAIHEARYDLETCAPGNEFEARKKLNELVLQSLARSGAKTSPSQVLDALYDDYKEFRRLKRRQQWPRV